MSVGILYDREDKACLYCTTTNVAFGLVFESNNLDCADDIMQEFIDWLELDPRSYDVDALIAKQYEFLRRQEPPL